MEFEYAEKTKIKDPIYFVSITTPFIVIMYFSFKAIGGGSLSDGLLFPASVVCYCLLSYFVGNVILEYKRNVLFKCSGCGEFLRGYQCDHLKSSACPYCKKPYLLERFSDKEMDWMKSFPGLKKKSVFKCLIDQLRYEFWIRWQIKGIKKKVYAVVETKSFMKYTKLEKELHEQEELIKTTRELEDNLSNEIKKLVQKVPFNGGVDLVQTLYRLKTAGNVA